MKKSGFARSVKFIVWFLIICCVLCGVGAGYDYYKNEGQNVSKAISFVQGLMNKKELNNEQIKEAKTSKPINESKENLESNEDLNEDIDSLIDSIANQTDTKPTTKPTQNKPITKQTRTKPKVAIIMDDLSFPYQIADLKSLNLVITPSLMPVTSDSPHTSKMAKNLDFYMVHLPLEPQDSAKATHSPLKLSDTESTIKQKVEDIKKDFPNVSFINNHTGSLFTQNYNSMKYLISALNKHNITFLDSRTTPNSVARRIYNELGKRLYERDVFLDNSPNVSYTLNQLKKVISVAKNKGYAIAIGHPHKSTFNALREAKAKNMFKDVELVYVKDLPIAKNEVLAWDGGLSDEALNYQISNDRLTSGEYNELDSAYNEQVENRHDLLSGASLFPANLNEANEPRDIDFYEPDLANRGDSQVNSPLIKNVPSENSNNPNIKVKAKEPKKPIVKIDKTMFVESKRLSESKQKVKTEASIKPESKLDYDLNNTKRQDCIQNDAEAFISGCKFEKTNPQKGFIDSTWTKEKR